MLPMSTNTVLGAKPRNGPPRQGRSSPSIRPKVRTALAIEPPVDPMETMTSASPLLTSRVATATEEFGLVRMARTGCSSSRILSSEGTTRTERPDRSCLASSRSTGSGSPTSIISALVALAAAMAPCTVSTGPWSPPMASMATRTGAAPSSIFFCIVFLPRLTGVPPGTTVPFAKGPYT